MKIIKTVRQMQSAAQNVHRKGLRIGLVPTMGALHRAHMSLVEKARRENDVVVVSIFVNPAQFGPNEDYLRYPRPFKNDAAACRKAGCDIIYNPAVKEMYGTDYLTYVKVEKLSDLLCGKSRPVHFRGVTTVVTKLFNAVLPDRAYFGLKDYQQLKIIQKMARDLDVPVKIIPCPIVREPDGLAMSSRNVYLTEKQRAEAPKIYQALKSVRKLIRTRKLKTIKDSAEHIRKAVSSIPDSRIDYIKFCHPETLKDAKGSTNQPLRLLAAVYVGKARLIDNIRI